MQSFDLVTIRVFLAIGREGSLGAAARAEHITASAVSRRISDLEQDLGVELVKRTPAGAHLTAAGQAFMTHCEDILASYSGARADMKRFADGDVGELRIAAVTSAITDKLPYVINRFRQDHPQIHVTLREVFSHDGLRLLREDQADLVIIADTIDTKGFESRHYASDPIWVIGAPGHPLFRDHQDGAAINFKEASRYETIVLHMGGAIDELIAAALKKEHATRNYSVETMRMETMRNCVKAGLGLGFVRESMARPHLQDGSLRGAPLSDDWADRRLVCACHKEHGIAPVVATFLDALQD